MKWVMNTKGVDKWGSKEVQETSLKLDLALALKNCCMAFQTN
jgi:hypothetical protein